MTRRFPDSFAAARPSLQSSIDATHRSEPKASEPDENARARLERLLLGAKSAAAFGHRLRLLDIETEHRAAWQRSHFNTNQPRVPAGNPDGGQWTSAGGGGSDPRTLSDVTPDNAWKPGARHANRSRRGSGRSVEMEGGQANRLAEAEARARDAIGRVRELDPSWRPRPSAYESVEGLIRAHESEAEQAQARLRELADLAISSQISKQRPPTAQERNAVAREIARAFVMFPRHLVHGVSWLVEYDASIEAYLDPPKSLADLQQAVSTPKKGYDLHHIVEKTSAEQDGFPRSMIDGRDNLVRISRFKHWEITGWYQRRNDEYGGLPPREYMRGKDWAERFAIGIKVLIDHGVLKP